MKTIATLIATLVTATAFAAEPAKAPATTSTPATTSAPAATPSVPKSDMKLAKKKDHSKDKKVAATKSPKTEAPKK